MVAAVGLDKIFRPIPLVATGLSSSKVGYHLSQVFKGDAGMQHNTLKYTYIS